MSKKIIVWGGYWNKRRKPLSVSELDSHASVSCYFLTQSLQKDFEVIQISGFYAIEDALNHQDAIAILSTFQAGFTRLYHDNPVIFHRLKLAFGNRLMSIIDFVSLQSYKEERLFTVLPPQRDPLAILKQKLAVKKVHWMGWCASSNYCQPKPTDRFQIFVDHPNYGGTDYSHVIFDALQIVCDECGKAPPEILVQTNRGIESWSKDAPYPSFDYDRKSKVPWLEIQELYGLTSLFIVTHPESAGLAVIEAAMSGARIVVPRNNGRSFISTALLSGCIDHITLECDKTTLADGIFSSVELGVDRFLNHQKLASSHDWSNGAARVREALS